MSSANCTNLISEALLLAGDTSLTARGVVWLNQWLRSQYMAWNWPFLFRKASGLTLASGTGTFVVGSVNGGVTNAIQRIFDPIYLYTTDKQNRGNVRFRELHGNDVMFDEDARPTTQTGTPLTVVARRNATTAGTWDLVLDPIPDRTFLMSFNYIYQPADVNGTSDFPVYPNDRTIVHALTAMALAHMGDERAREMREVAAIMTIDDRNKFGSHLGFNDKWLLDGDTYR